MQLVLSRLYSFEVNASFVRSSREQKDNTGFDNVKKERHKKQVFSNPAPLSVH